MRWFSVLYLSLFCMNVAVASSLDSMNKEEVDSLTLSQLSEVEPELYKLLKGVLPVTLAKLAYNVGDYDIEKAVSAFQKDLKADVTGDITMHQFEQLNKRAEKSVTHKIYLPFDGIGNKPSIYISDNYAKISGTWVFVDSEDKMAFPINHSVYECYRETGHCFISEVQFYSPESSNSSHIYHSTDVTKFDKWGEDEIVMSTSSKCRNSTITINSKSEEVIQVARNNGEDCTLLTGEVIDNLEKPRIAKLISGFEFSQDFFEKREEEGVSLMSSEFQELVKSIKNASNE